MDEPKKNKTKTSNINQTSNQNDNNKDEANLKGTENTGNEFSNVSKAVEQNEEDRDEVQEDVSSDHPNLGNDYWDRVADDVVTRYTTNEDEDDILNIDQLPDDNVRGDEEPE